MKNNSMIMGAVAVVIAAAGFFGGITYERGRIQPVGFGGPGMMRQGGYAPGQDQANGQGQRGTNGMMRRGGFAPIQGDILAIDPTSITIKLQDGSTKIINVASSTTVSKTQTGNISELKVGDKVAAFGTTNQDGSVTAQNVQLNPVFRGMGGVPFNANSPAPTATQKTK